MSCNWKSSAALWLQAVGHLAQLPRREAAALRRKLRDRPLHDAMEQRDAQALAIGRRQGLRARALVGQQRRQRPDPPVAEHQARPGYRARYAIVRQDRHVEIHRHAADMADALGAFPHRDAGGKQAEMIAALIGRWRRLLRIEPRLGMSAGLFQHGDEPRRPRAQVAKMASGAPHLDDAHGDAAPGPRIGLDDGQARIRRGLRQVRICRDTGGYEQNVRPRIGHGLSDDCAGVEFVPVPRARHVSRCEFALGLVTARQDETHRFVPSGAGSSNRVPARLS